MARVKVLVRMRLLGSREDQLSGPRHPGRGHPRGYSPGSAWAGPGDRIPARDVPGQDQHRHSLQSHGVLDPDPDQRRHLRRLRHQLAPVAGLIKQLLRMGFLEEPGPDLVGGDVRGQHEYWRARAVRIEYCLDEVGVAGTAASGAHREPAGQLRLLGPCKRCRLPRCARAPSQSRP